MMFRRSPAPSKTSGDGPALDSAILPVTSNLNAPSVSMKLGNNILTINEKGAWSLESSDLDNASELIEKLMEEKENLALSLSQSVDQIEKLTTEIYEINEIKAVVLEMLMNERKQRLELEDEVNAYKEELKDSYKAIVELRKLIPQQE